MESVADDEFLIHPLADSAGYSLVTPSGSSRAQVGAHETVISTEFFDGFEEADSRDRRDEYILKKLDAIGENLERGGVRFLFIGLTQIAQLPLIGNAAKHYRRATVPRLLARPEAMVGSGEPFDFTFRVSRHLGELAYFNVYVGWYQSRKHQILIRADELAVAHPWDGVLDSEGLEVRFDMNNKRGLYDGKKRWSWAELRGVVEIGLDEAGRSLGDVLEALPDVDVDGMEDVG